MGMREAIQPYLDKYGMVSGPINPTSPSGNCIMFTSEWIIALREKKFSDAADNVWFSKNLELMSFAKGWYARTPFGEPFHDDPIAWDDLVGLATWSAGWNNAHAIELLNFLRNTEFKWGPFSLRYYYPAGPKRVKKTEEGGEWELDDYHNVKRWIGRNPAMPAHFQFAAGLKPNFIRRLCWAVAIATSGFRNEQGQDPWRLSYLMIKARPRGRGICAVAEWIWKKRFRKAWPGGLRQCRAVYFGGEAPHPLAVYAEEFW
jgi:hypothetical protein